MAGSTIDPDQTIYTYFLTNLVYPFTLHVTALKMHKFEKV